MLEGSVISVAISLLLATTAQQATTQPAEEDPVVCHGRSESVVGTRIKPKKICMKKSDWDYQEKHTQRELQQINQRGNNPAPIPSGPARGGEQRPH
jgi:hypothetical protein